VTSSWFLIHTDLAQYLFATTEFHRKNCEHRGLTVCGNRAQCKRSNDFVETDFMLAESLLI